ncbi:MAG: nucleotidyl transferase AbiEii/AbiGii toxin family protein [Candidatus Methanomethylicia archaeon]
MKNIIKTEDIIHRSYLNRILLEIADSSISLFLGFKGGTCALMLDYLDRFSIDLDFDLIEKNKEKKVRKEIKNIISALGLKIKKEMKNTIMFEVNYPNEIGKRNTIKLSVTTIPPKANKYKYEYLPDIARVMRCQTIETMFGNKLVAITDRYNKHKSIAGRDLYDIHHFFIKGYKYSKEVIEERTKKKAIEYFEELEKFIARKINQKIIDEDLNTLLPYEKFRSIRKIIIPETLSLIREEIVKLKGDKIGS